ncbi:hypothetical protein EXE46_12655 [Halorubrum sp. GN11_10-6_MGM]|uniref:hypothetical protein n=1 Tax=Halorubrum sp. GN11_10-6_MGM TaxID=2518112 RepID=UPI0010F624DA|nr:hypothetical protein [Halorubrum sp. GN11_10-6_MGM]TKX73718.1 hypothetical protein EXE46_12655 [Halorubrum sp. GN11_10-6_MGM]
MAVIVAGFTALWALGVIDVAVPIVGYAWFAVAAIGTVVAVGMTTRKDDVVEADASTERVEEFEEATVTGLPLNLYVGALAAWAAVSFGWVLGGMSAAGLEVVGYGWLAIAAYGAIVGIGLARNHNDELATAVNPSETLDTDS